MTEHPIKNLRAAMYYGILFGGIFALVLTFILSGGDTADTPNPSRFEIVDKYGECDVIRYTKPNGGATYAYFLHCKSEVSE
jgi:hypothetical protein